MGICGLRYRGNSSSNRWRCISGHCLLEPQRPYRLQHHLVLWPLRPGSFVCYVFDRAGVDSHQITIKCPKSRSWILGRFCCGGVGCVPSDVFQIGRDGTGSRVEFGYS